MAGGVAARRRTKAATQQRQQGLPGRTTAPGIGHNKPPEINFEIAEPFLFLITEKARYKAVYGGRGGAKSWSIARALILIAMREYPDEHGPCLIVCAREYQSTIRDSVHRVIAGQIRLMGLQDYFEIGQATITCLLTGAV